MKKWFLIVFLLFSITGEAQIITTVAGNGIGGYSGDSGLATSASVGNMVGIAFDRLGNYYFSENNNTVRKVSKTGIITTVAGTGTAGYNGDGLLATTAQLSRPVYVALDTLGNLYIADENNNRVRKVDTSGIISTIAGTGVAGYNGDGEHADSAELNEPYSVCLDARGNIYIADLLNWRIRKINPSGIITTYVGNGTGGYSGDGGLAVNAQINSTGVICTDAIGNLYLCDGARVRKVNASTDTITTFAGNGTFGYIGDSGAANSAELWSLAGITSDAYNNIFIADGNRIREIDTLGMINTVAGNDTAGFRGDGSLATTAELYSTRGVAMDTCNNLYICDNGNVRIRKVTFDTSCGHGIPERVTTQKIFQEKVIIYPNPATSELTIISPNKINNITITNLLGQIVQSETVYAEKAEMNIAALSPGIYFVKVTDSEGQKKVTKIVKQ